jgi:hypothetical protein
MRRLSQATIDPREHFAVLSVSAPQHQTFTSIVGYGYKDDQFPLSAH